jgi:DNA topoisomerase-3
MNAIVIAEKGSQARDILAAVGTRYGRVLAAEGHLLRLAEPEEVAAEWKRWSYVVLKPDGLYPTRPDKGGNKAAKLKTIAEALKQADRVIIATDCDREGQLIGQEILEHHKFRGEVLRAMFTAQDVKTLRDAFANLRPNAEYRGLYQAAVARQQADQIFNLSLTRAATVGLRTPGARGVIGIGRVKTPTLAIVCMRELEIRNFVPEDYFEVVATATVAAGSFPIRHAPPPAARIKSREAAEAIARLAEDFSGPLAVKVEDRRQGPPKLYDLPSLQKTCGQRWGWSADRTLAVAQELYDGEGKKLITYPRAEARYLTEDQAGDIPAVTAALTRLRGFAHLDLSRPVIRRGKSGHFWDKGLEGVSHHAVVPNVNVMDDVENRIGRCSDDEKRLFALICRSYLAAVMPDYRYRQTTATMDVSGHLFRAVGRVPIEMGWKAAFGSAEPDNNVKKGDDDADQILPPLVDGETAHLTDATVEAKRTQAPPRYNEGTLVDAMQNAWRFVNDPVQADRLKEAKGIGTPATRAAVLEGLKRQGFLERDGKWIVPTEAGLDLYGLLLRAAPALVDPATTAMWELRLDSILRDAADVREVIDAIADEAARLIDILRGQAGTGAAIALPDKLSDKPAERRGRKRGAGTGTGRRRGKADGGADADTTPPTARAAKTPPTEKMLRFAQSLAQQRGIALPDDIDADFELCRRFLDAHAGSLSAGAAAGRPRPNLTSETEAQSDSPSRSAADPPDVAPAKRRSGRSSGRRNVPRHPA